jgi:hypothetical protein
MLHVTRARLMLTLAFAGLALAGSAQAQTTGCNAVENTTTKTLRILGNIYKQNAIIEIHNDGSWAASIDCNGNGSYTDGIDINNRTGVGPVFTYDIQLAGQDNISIIQTDNLVGQTRDIIVNAVGGINFITYSTQNLYNVTSSTVAFELVGGNRDDHLTFDFSGSTFTDSAFFIRGDFSYDADHLTLTGPPSLLNSTLDVNVDMGGGRNKVTIADGGPSSTIDNSTFAVNVQGAGYIYGSGYDDTIKETLSGTVRNGSRVFLDTALGDGDDSYTVNFGVASFKVDPAASASSEVIVYARGDGGFDGLNFGDLGQTGPAEVNGLVEITFDGGTQPDALIGDWNGLTGSGTMRVHFSAADGFDYLLAGLLTDPTANNTLDFVLEGAATGGIVPGVGKTLYLGLLDPGTSNFGPAGRVILAGAQDGRSYCNYFGDAPSLLLQCASGS